MKKVKVCNFLFFLAYSLFLAYSFLGHISVFDTIFEILNLFVIFILFICFLLSNSYKLRELFLLVGFLIFAIVVSSKSQYYALFKLMMFLSAMKYVDFKKLIQIDSKIRIILILFTLFLFKIGVAPNVLYSMSDGTLRESFGFTNPNIFAFHLFVYAIELIYIRDFKMSVGYVVFLLILYFFIGSVIKCRTAVLMLVFMMLLVLLYNYFPKIFYNKLVKFIMCNGVSIFALMTFIFVTLYAQGNAKIVSLNTLLSNRLGRIVIFANKFDVTLLGQDISILEMSLDNSYAFICLCCGILVSLLFLVSMTYLMYKLYKRNNVPLAIILFGFFLYGFSEHIWINFNYNVFMLAFHFLIYPNKGEERHVLRKHNVSNVATYNIKGTNKL